MTTQKTHFGSKKPRDVMKPLDQPLRGDISGIQDVQSYSPEYNINFQKYKKMTVNEFLDLFPLPKQSSGRKFHFLHSFKTPDIKIRGFGLIELRHLFLKTSRYQHTTYKPQTQLQAPKTKIKLLRYKFSLVIDHLSP